ncbi:MAG: hypothetical protein LBI28_13030 [Treponema sp.]|nr:hypothetical protein [Treponema sp.]
MALVFFWLKIAVKRIVQLVKISPVIVIGSIIIITVLISARIDLTLTLDTQKFIIVASAFIILPLSLSLKNYNLHSNLVLYSKSKLINKTIRGRFFLGRAFINNILLLIFNIIALKGIIKIENIIYLPIITVFSIVLSFLVMLAKNKYTSKKIIKTKTTMMKTNSVIKSTFQDYFSSDFFLTTSAVYTLCVIFVMELLKDTSQLREMSFLHLFSLSFVAVLSIGFMGIIDSIPRANWKFYAVISPNSFKYHYKRTLLFLLSVFCLPIAAFVLLVFSSFTNIMALNNFLFYMAIILCLSISVGFTNGNMLIKAIVLIAAAVLTLQLIRLSVYFLLLSVFFTFLTTLKAKNEYKERYYL